MQLHLQKGVDDGQTTKLPPAPSIQKEINWLTISIFFIRLAMTVLLRNRTTSKCVILLMSPRVQRHQQFSYLSPFNTTTRFPDIQEMQPPLKFEKVHRLRARSRLRYLLSLRVDPYAGCLRGTSVGCSDGCSVPPAFTPLGARRLFPIRQIYMQMNWSKAF